MELRCACGAVVCEGEVKSINNKMKFILDTGERLKGTILKNNSNNPSDWGAICSECQKKKDKEVENGRTSKA